MEKIQFSSLEFENTVNEYDILVVGFYNPDEERYLMIQYQEEYDADDIELGLNTYHIERDDQSFGEYGGVYKVILSSHQIQFLLTERGKENLQCEEVLIDFKIAENDWNKLKESLIKIFGENFSIA